MLLLNQPTPVRRRFSFTQCFRVSSAPEGALVLKETVSCSGFVAFSQLEFHVLDRSKLEQRSFAAWRENGWRDFKHLGRRDCASITSLFRGWPSYDAACWVRRCTRCFFHRLAGAMPDSTEKKSAGVDRRHPVIILIVWFRMASIFLT